MYLCPLPEYRRWGLPQVCLCKKIIFIVSISINIIGHFLFCPLTFPKHEVKKLKLWFKALLGKCEDCVAKTTNWPFTFYIKRLLKKDSCWLLWCSNNILTRISFIKCSIYFQQLWYSLSSLSLMHDLNPACTHWKKRKKKQVSILCNHLAMRLLCFRSCKKMCAETHAKIAFCNLIVHACSLQSQCPCTCKYFLSLE